MNVLGMVTLSWNFTRLALINRCYRVSLFESTFVLIKFWLFKRFPSNAYLDIFTVMLSCPVSLPMSCFFLPANGALSFTVAVYTAIYGVLTFFVRHSCFWFKFKLTQMNIISLLGLLHQVFMCTRFFVHQVFAMCTRCLCAPGVCAPGVYLCAPGV